MVKELDVLLEQVGEMLAEWPSDGEDAVELATVAGLAARLGASASDLEEAEVWRDGAGSAILEEGWAEVDIDDLVEGVEAVCNGMADTNAVEEAVYEFDDHVAAAVWSNCPHHVRKATTRVSHAVRDLPEVFAGLSEFASQLASLEAVSRDIDLYDYWIAIAQAREWTDEVKKPVV